MLIGLISDSHGHIGNTLHGLQLLSARKVELILHCGDIGGLEIPRLFDLPTHFVLGNVDQDEDEMRESIEQCGHMLHGRFGELQLAGVRVALLHGDQAVRRDWALSAGDFDLVCQGHTHVREDRIVGGTRLVNPGAVYRARPHSVATVRLPELMVEFLEF